jgi:hypothetical protein
MGPIGFGWLIFVGLLQIFVSFYQKKGWQGAICIIFGVIYLMIAFGLI